MEFLKLRRRWEEELIWDGGGEWFGGGRERGILALAMACERENRDVFGSNGGRGRVCVFLSLLRIERREWLASLVAITTVLTNSKDYYMFNNNVIM